MPFGKWKGTCLQDVPADYLHWFWQKSNRDTKTPLGCYIRDRLAALKKEYPNGIWT